MVVWSPRLSSSFSPVIVTVSTPSYVLSEIISFCSTNISFEDKRKTHFIILKVEGDRHSHPPKSTDTECDMIIGLLVCFPRDTLVKTLKECDYSFQEFMISPTCVSIYLNGTLFIGLIFFFYWFEQMTMYYIKN